MEHKKKSIELYECMNALTARIMQTQQNLFDGDLGKFNIKDINVLRVLGMLGECKMRDIANALRIPESTLTGLIDGLVKKKYVERFRTDEDRRIVKVCLTDKGNNVINTLTEKHLEVYDHMLETLDPAEQDKLINLFKKISKDFH